MWNKMAAWLKSIFLGSRPEEASIPDYVLPGSWPFPGPRPTNMAIHKLYENMETIGDHIMYRSHETGRLGGTVWDGEQSWLVKQLTFWISGGTLNPAHTFNTMRSTCGFQRCARPDHLKVKYNPDKQEKKPDTKNESKVKVSKVSGPPVYNQEKTQPRRDLDSLLGGDRTKCVSAKVWFSSKEEAEDVAYEYNTEHREKGARKLYGYDCDWCDGGHLSKQNPATRRKYEHPGSWS